jgi:hypothetical protein
MNLSGGKMLKKILAARMQFLLLLLFSIAALNCGVKEVKKKQTAVKQAPVAYQGVIDVKAVDANKDGKIYQCPMDYNVLSDQPGNCTECNMDLEEVTIQEAEDNLVKNDFTIKK